MYGNESELEAVVVEVVVVESLWMSSTLRGVSGLYESLSASWEMWWPRWSCPPLWPLPLDVFLFLVGVLFLLRMEK